MTYVFAGLWSRCDSFRNWRLYPQYGFQFGWHGANEWQQAMCGTGLNYAFHRVVLQNAAPGSCVLKASNALRVVECGVKRRFSHEGTGLDLRRISSFVAETPFEKAVGLQQSKTASGDPGGERLLSATSTDRFLYCW